MSFIERLFNRKEMPDPATAQETDRKELLRSPEDTKEVEIAQNSDSEDEPVTYEVLEREVLPAKIICPDCGGITLEGLEFCDKCGGELL